MPLERVVRALDLIRAGHPVTRGTLQTVFTHMPFDELVRLGLDGDDEQFVRTQSTDNLGMLVVKGVVPGGPGAGAGAGGAVQPGVVRGLQPGDILLRINTRPVVKFTELEEIIDSSVGEDLTIEVVRGAEHVELVVTVQDLFSISPSSFLEAGESVFNDLSYHTARHYNLPTGGAYIAKAGYMLKRSGITAGCVVTKVAGVAIRDITDLAVELSKVPDGGSVPVRVYNVSAVTVLWLWPWLCCETVTDQTARGHGLHRV